MGRQKFPKLSNSDLETLLPLCKDHFADWSHDTTLQQKDPGNLLANFVKLTENFIQKHEQLQVQNRNSAKRKFFKNVNKNLERARILKQKLKRQMKFQKRKKIPIDPKLRKKFWTVFKLYSKLKKQENSKNEQKRSRFFEKLYKQNFWDFATKACDGTLESQPISPDFSRAEANRFYSERYQTQRNAFSDDFFDLFCARPDEDESDTPEKPNVEFNLSDFSYNELWNYLKRKPMKKATGPDQVPIWFLKYFRFLLHPLANLFNKFLYLQKAPGTWAKCVFRLIYKKGEANIPTNFRMIAISSVVGKLFHGVLANRCLKFLTANDYVDKKIQKSFLPEVSGCVEHCWSLLDLMNHAKHKRKTLHLVFLDFSDAFGSVCHNMLPILLKRYHFPSCVSGYIMSLYSQLNGKVSTSCWESDPFSLKTGVFQGDPLSVAIFMLYVQPILTYLIRRYQRNSFLGHCVKAFADDTVLIQKDMRDMKTMIVESQKFSAMMGLKLNAKKCKFLSIRSGKCDNTVKFFMPTHSYEISRANDPSKFTYDQLEPISSDPSKAFCYLGMPITSASMKTFRKNQFLFIENRLKSMLENLDSTLIRSEYKLKIFVSYLQPSLRYLLSICDIKTCHSEKLDLHARKFIKKWLRLPKSATSSFFQHPDSLFLCSFTFVAKNAKLGALIDMRGRSDEWVKESVRRKEEREASFTKHKSLVVSENLLELSQKFLENEEEKDFEVDAIRTKGELNSAKRQARKTLIEIERQRHNSKLESLLVQGRFGDLLNGEDFKEDPVDLVSFREFLWRLPKGFLSFVNRSFTCTLSVKTNMKRWNYVKSGTCCRCDRPETVKHCLAGCENSLDRYTWRHDSILVQILKTAENLISNSNSENSKIAIFADLPGKLESTSPKSTLPSEILDDYPCSQRPDMVFVCSNNRNQPVFCAVLELTVPFDSNIHIQHQNKMNRYQNPNQSKSLINEINHHCNCKYFAFEIGCSGILTKGNKQRLREFLNLIGNIARSDFKDLCYNLCRIAIGSSKKIFECRNESWDKSLPFYS